jgi:hypothetical protein
MDDTVRSSIDRLPQHVRVEMCIGLAGQSKPATAAGRVGCSTTAALPLRPRPVTHHGGLVSLGDHCLLPVSGVLKAVLGRGVSGSTIPQIQVRGLHEQRQKHRKQAAASTKLMSLSNQTCTACTDTAATKHRVKL